MKGKKFHCGLVFGVLFLAIGIRLLIIVTGNFIFHFDSARDWLWVRHLLISKKPILVGPWSSLQGVFYGPLTYYLLAAFFWMFNGHPAGGSLWALVLNTWALAAVYWFLVRQFSGRTAIIGLILTAFSLISLRTSVFIFQAHPSLLLGALTLTPLFKLAERKPQALLWLLFLASLGVHTNLFWTLLLLPYFIVRGYQAKIKLTRQQIFLAAGAALLPLMPQIAFEARHDFLQTLSLWSYLTGENQSLGASLSLGPLLADRIQLFFSLWGQSAGGVNKFFSLVMLAGVSGLWITRYRNGFSKAQASGLISLLGIIGIFLGFSLVFRSQFKLWYLYGLTPAVITLTAVSLERFLKTFKFAGVLVGAYLIFFSLSNSLTFLAPLFERRRDLQLYSNQKQVVDKVMALGAKTVYSVYTYTEPIYDYPYQYLFWWLSQRNGQGPVKYGYLPDKYDYVIGKQDYDPPASSAGTLYLILEKDNPASDYRWETWRKAFYEYKPGQIFELPNGVRIEKLDKISDG